MRPFPPAHLLAFMVLASSGLALSFSTHPLDMVVPSRTSSFRASNPTSSFTLPSSTSSASAAASTSGSSTSGSSRLHYSLPRLGLYVQTFHDSNNNPVSLLPLITEKGIAMTHIFIAAFHVAQNASGFHLNDFPPSDHSYDALWAEVKALQAHGVRVLGMVGGSAPGSFGNTTLDAPDKKTFETAYLQLQTLVKTYNLNGLDLDVEQTMSQLGIERLVNRLKTDFGSDFEVTLAPVASALYVGPTAELSGFNYHTLETHLGDSVAFYNAQFYNGWGDITVPGDFEKAVTYGFAAEKVCVGVLTNSTNGGGYVNISTLNQTLATLANKYTDIGALANKYSALCGVTGWEYFNAQPGGEASPWEWAKILTSILRPGMATKLRLTRREAEHLTRAWERSKIAPGEGRTRRRGQPSALDYFTLVLK